MTRMAMGEAVRRTLSVPLPIDRAFALFTDEMTIWWPRQNTFAKEAFVGVFVEPRAGRRWFERDVGGREKIWGRVLAWEPPAFSIPGQAHGGL